MTSEGTTIRTSRSLAAIEAALDTHADDGMPLHNYYAAYVAKPAGPARRRHRLQRARRRPARDLMALRVSPLVPDYTGPVLFDAPAAGFAARAGSRALDFRRAAAAFDDAGVRSIHGAHGRAQRMVAAASARACFPTSVSLIDDPTLKDFQGPAASGHLRCGRRRRESRARQCWSRTAF